jgi:hypothetical protein
MTIGVDDPQPSRVIRLDAKANRTYCYANVGSATNPKPGEGVNR